MHQRPDHHADLSAFQCVTVPENGVRRAKTGPSRRISGKMLRDGGKRYIKGRIRKMPDRGGHDGGKREGMTGEGKVVAPHKKQIILSQPAVSQNDFLSQRRFAT